MSSNDCVARYLRLTEEYWSTELHVVPGVSLYSKTGGKIIQKSINRHTRTITN